MCANLFFCMGPVNTVWLIILSLHKCIIYYIFSNPTKWIIQKKDLSAFWTISAPIIFTTRQKEQSLCTLNTAALCSSSCTSVFGLINIRQHVIDWALLWFDVCEGLAVSGLHYGLGPQTSAGMESPQRNRKEWGNGGHLPTGKAKGTDCLTGECMGWWCEQCWGVVGNNSLMEQHHLNVKSLIILDP